VLEASVLIGSALDDVNEEVLLLEASVLIGSARVGVTS